MQKFSIGRDILHGSAIMGKSDITLAIHNAVQGHTAKFEKVDLLLIHSGNRVISIRQANERNIFIRPKLFEGCH